MIVLVELPQIGEHLAVGRIQEALGAAAEGVMGFAHGQHPAHPVEQRVRVARLRLDVHRLEAVDGVHDRR